MFFPFLSKPRFRGVNPCVMGRVREIVGKRNYCGYAGLMLFIVLLFSIANASMHTFPVMENIIYVKIGKAHNGYVVDGEGDFTRYYSDCADYLYFPHKFKDMFDAEAYIYRTAEKCGLAVKEYREPLSSINMYILGDSADSVAYVSKILLASMITEIILVIILFIFFALCIVNCVEIGKEGDRG